LGVEGQKSLNTNSFHSRRIALCQVPPVRILAMRKPKDFSHEPISSWLNP